MRIFIFFTIFFASSQNNLSLAHSNAQIEMHRKSKNYARFVKLVSQLHSLKIREDQKNDLGEQCNNKCNTGVFIDMFQAAVSGDKKDDSTPISRNGQGNVRYLQWCTSFIQWALWQTEISTGTLSPVKPSKKSVIMWDDSPDTIKVTKEVPDFKNPKPGWIAVWKLKSKLFSTNNEEDTEDFGHAEIVLSAKGGLISTIGGNTQDFNDSNSQPVDGVFLHENFDPQKFGLTKAQFEMESRYEFLGYLKAFD
jgi:CHAP domain